MLSVAVTPDGRRLVSGGDDGTLRLWDAQTGRPIGDPLTRASRRVRSVAVTPDGRRLVSGGWDGTLRLWDAQTGQPIGAPLTGHQVGEERRRHPRRPPPRLGRRRRHAAALGRADRPADRRAPHRASRLA